jgi:hypothetical protein
LARTRHAAHEPVEDAALPAASEPLLTLGRRTSRRPWKRPRDAVSLSGNLGPRVALQRLLGQVEPYGDAPSIGFLPVQIRSLVRDTLSEIGECAGAMPDRAPQTPTLGQLHAESPRWVWLHCRGTGCYHKATGASGPLRHPVGRRRLIRPPSTEHGVQGLRPQRR